MASTGQTRTEKKMSSPNGTQRPASATFSSPFRLLALLTVTLAALLFASPAYIFQKARVLGLTRPKIPPTNIHGHGATVIPDTLYCEDLHYHEASGFLFSASEPNESRRWEWFPPMAKWGDPKVIVGQAAIVKIDPKTLKAQRLEMLNYNEPFTAHGLDVWSYETDPLSVYIIAINHLPNPAHYASSKSSEPKARSRLEIFRHELNSSTVHHLRSVWHPLIRTPNDVLAVSATEFYITNDHRYPSEPLRTLEALEFPGFAHKTDTIHVSLASLGAQRDADGVNATVAVAGIHNNNGLGYGSSSEEILIGRAEAGILTFLEREDDHVHLKVTQEVQLDSAIDNPVYFKDIYAKETGKDASGYVMAGLYNAQTWPSANGNPTIVWLVQPVPGADPKTDAGWTKKVIFQDDGKLLDSAATAVMIAVDPAQNGGKKQAQLFVTGPVSKAIVATVIDL